MSKLKNFFQRTKENLKLLCVFFSVLRNRINLRDRRQLLWFSGAIVAVLLFVCIFALDGGQNFDRIGRYFTYLKDPDGDYAFDAGTANAYASFDDGLAIASISGLFTYNNIGEETNISQQPMNAPAILSNGQMVFAYDIGGSVLTAIEKERGIVLQTLAEGDLYDADLSDDNCICYASTASGYKSKLAVLDQEQNEIYQWYSSSQFYNVCAISDKAEYLTAVSLGQVENTFESTAVIFKTTEEEPVANVSLGDQFIYDLEFVSDNVVCAVSDEALQLFRCDGKSYGSYSYEDQYLIDFDLNGDDFIVVVLNMYKAGLQNTLVTVNQRGEEIASVYLGENIYDISAAGKYLAVLSSSGLKIYNKNLKVCSSLDEDVSANNVVMREDGSAILIGNRTATTFVP